jgi:hypothetical protein
MPLKLPWFSGEATPVLTAGSQSAPSILQAAEAHLRQ